MVKAGDGYRFHVTGLTHDEQGYPVMNADCQEKLVRRLVDKIRNNADKIVRIEEADTDGADVVVVSYGITSRVALKAIQMAKAEGIKVGHLRLITVWPFPEKPDPQAGRTHQSLRHARTQLRPDVPGTAARGRRKGRIATWSLTAAAPCIEPEVIYQKIKEAAK